MINYDGAKRPSNIVTEQIVIETKYNTRLIPITAEKDSIDEINNALETAKKEHELLGLKDQMIIIYQEHINFILYGSKHGKQLDLKTMCDIVTKITELERELK